MRKITDFITDHCYAIFAVFLVITGICALLSTKVNINKNIYSYMPVDSETSMALDIMNEEFDYDQTSSYQIMLDDVPAEEKTKIKEEIEAIDGVGSVDYNDSEEYNRDNHTRYAINIDAPADSETANRVYQEIKNKYKEQYKFVAAGQVHDYNGEILNFGVILIAVGCAMVILLIMSQSWIEPFLFLFVILLAVVVNKGTNIIFPSVSHITDSIAAILQMALSMDYAIMLSTRYRQERSKKDCPDKKTAMRRAMRYSFGAISSSSITTVVGLIVLVFMSFTIGRDMGLVLSKGVVLSLFSIFTSLPALLLLFDKAITKTEKKTLNLKMDWLAKFANGFRKFALPLFLIIFVGGLLLKGNALIQFTASDNNKIKDVFEQTNQIALVYDGKMDDQVTNLCNELDAREDTTRVLCYGNTINEPEKYNEVVPKVNELSDEKLDTEEYLIKAIYYHYYKDVDAHTITLDDFVTFLQQDVFTNKDLSKDVSKDTKTEIDRLSNFTNSEKVNRPRTKEDIAQILGVDPAKLDDVYVLYLAQNGVTVKLTMYQFASFVSNEVLTNERYASMITAQQRDSLAKLLLFSNSANTDTPKSSAELAQMFGLSEDQVKQIMVYYGYTSIETPSMNATIEQLVNFALTDENALAELGISSEEASSIKAQIESAKNTITAKKDEALAKYDELNSYIDSKIAELPEEDQEKIKPSLNSIRAELNSKISAAEYAMQREYSYSDIESAANTIESAYNTTLAWLDNLETNYPEIFEQLDEETKAEVFTYINQIKTTLSEAHDKINLSDKLAQLKNLYKLYQAKSSEPTMTARELVNFLLSRKDDSRLSGALTPSAISQLQLVQFIMNNQATPYSAGALAQTFGLDAEKLRLVYALYEYRYVNQPQLSLWTLINFINDTILPNPEYASQLGESEQTKLRTIHSLMHAAAIGTPYNYNSLYNALLPLSGDLDKNMLFLAYLYHGSLYDYDENWTLTLEVFINFLADDVLSDSRFAARIDDEMSEKILSGQKTINDAKALLVGPNHYRALIESHLPSEGEQTFGLIKHIKDELGPKNKVDYFVVGDSAMAYEMAQTFDSEMNFITILTMLSIFAVVIWTFKSFLVSTLLVLVIQSAVYIVMSYLSLTGSGIYFIALIIVQSILMGATIDYGILFTSYYVENRSYFKMNIKEALINTYNKSISAILTSASILVIVTAIVGNFGTAIASKICKLISLGTFCATVIILVLLPPLLAVLDKFIIKRKAEASKEKSTNKLLSALKSIL
ncbi:MMPL family transporter [Candidatus Saccharibacteria bacterium]|nr:MMPL family transporter [Candidatus Saccharibacteria bacterium]